MTILSRLIPAGVDGGISTAPLSYKAWMASADRADWQRIAAHVTTVLERLIEVRRDTGQWLHLDIEPEPDCSLETTDEAIAFFEQWLRPVALARLATRFGWAADEALAHIRDHVTICFDCCHVAVEFEDAQASLRKFDAAGIRIGRVQLSSALRVQMPADAGAAEQTAERLRPFADATYLHQTVEQRTGTRRQFADLPDALATAGHGDADREWRIHFHVPLFTAEYDRLGSTQDVVRAVIASACRTAFTHHLEIETYTWDVLPPGLKMDVAVSIEREFRWVLNEVARAHA